MQALTGWLPDIMRGLGKFLTVRMAKKKGLNCCCVQMRYFKVSV